MKIDFLVKGDRRITKKKSPEVDLFRIFHVEYVEKSALIMNPILMEFQRAYDKIALNPEKLPEIANVINFALRNHHYAMGCPIFYSTLVKYLERTVQKENTNDIYIKISYLYENGLLPHRLTASSSEEESRARKILGKMLEYASGKSPELPSEFSSNYMLKFGKWLDNLCRENNLC